VGASTDGDSRGRLRVALDASVMVGELGGPGVAFQHLLHALSVRDDLTLSVFALGLKSGDLSVRVPKGVAHTQRHLPARLTRALWQHSRWPSIQTLSGPTAVVHSFGGVIAPRRGTPMLVSVHDATPLTHEGLSSPSELSRLRSLRRAMESGTIVHTPTAAVKADLVHGLGLEASRIIVIPFGVPVLDTRDQVAVEKWLPAGIDRYVIALGADVPRKGFATLIQAFQQLADEDASLGLILIGRCGAENIGTTSRIRHGDRILRTGSLSSAEAAALLRGAEMLVYPSLSEGFGFPPLQAMAAGVPVIASDLAALKEVAADAALFARPGDSGALAHAMAVLLENSALRRDLIIRGRKRVQQFSWQHSAARFAEIYRLIHDRG